MGRSKISKEKLFEARKLYAGGMTYDIIAEQMGVNPKWLKKRLNEEKQPIFETESSKKGYEKKKKINGVRQRQVAKLMKNAEIGKKFIYNEFPEAADKKGRKVIRSGIIFYADDFKIGIIRPNKCKEFFTMNDLMPLRVKAAIA